MSLVVDHPAEGPDFRVLAGQPAPAEVEYYFLLGRYIDTATLARASALAAQWGVHPHDVLIANGWLAADGYYRALAESCGTSFKPVLAPTETVPPGGTTPRQCLACGLLKERARSRHYVLAPERLRPNAVRAMLAQLAPYDFTLATPRAVREAVSHHFAPALAQAAVEGLAIRRPEQSARTRTVLWQRAALIAVGASLLGALLLAPIDIVRAVTLLLAVLFVPVIGLRAAAAYELLRGDASLEPSRESRVPDAALPTYTILVPLYREAHMLPSLVQALSRLDWPAAKLDIKLVLEAVDQATVAAAQGAQPSRQCGDRPRARLAPRTKPKALNYALPLARGEYLVIYDAEDRPERDQLRRAFEAFRVGPPISPRFKRGSISTMRAKAG